MAEEKTNDGWIILMKNVSNQGITHAGKHIEVRKIMTFDQFIFFNLSFSFSYWLRNHPKEQRLK